MKRQIDIPYYVTLRGDSIRTCFTTRASQKEQLLAELQRTHNGRCKCNYIITNIDDVDLGMEEVCTDSISVPVRMHATVIEVIPDDILIMRFVSRQGTAFNLMNEFANATIIMANNGAVTDEYFAENVGIPIKVVNAGISTHDIKITGGIFRFQPKQLIVEVISTPITAHDDALQRLTGFLVQLGKLNAKSVVKTLTVITDHPHRGASFDTVQCSSLTPGKYIVFSGDEEHYYTYTGPDDAMRETGDNFIISLLGRLMQKMNNAVTLAKHIRESGDNSLDKYLRIYEQSKHRTGAVTSPQTTRPVAKSAANPAVAKRVAKKK